MIFIDSRIGSRDLAPHFTRHRIPVELTTLEYGDCAWMGNGPNGQPVFVGVERKRLKDFLSSMESGRLAGHQLVGMMNAYHHVVVIIEGVWRTGDSGLVETCQRVNGAKKWSWSPLELGGRQYTTSAVDNFSSSIFFQLGIPVIHTPTAERTAQWMANTYRWFTTKKWEQHRSVGEGVKHTTPIPVGISGKAPLVARVAMEFRGVGRDRAMAISRKYRTVRDFVCGADVEGLESVEGVGRTTAHNMIREMDGEV